jgi:hypothetical protein
MKMFVMLALMLGFASASFAKEEVYKCGSIVVETDSVSNEVIVKAKKVYLRRQSAAALRQEMYYKNTDAAGKAFYELGKVEVSVAQGPASKAVTIYSKVNSNSSACLLK